MTRETGWLLFYVHLLICLFIQVSGSKFYYLKNEAVMLEMALINWTLSEVMKRGFTPLTTPELVRSSIVEKCGFQPRGDNTQVCSHCGFLTFLYQLWSSVKLITKLPLNILVIKWKYYNWI